MNTFAEYPVSAGYDEKYIEEPLRTKLFGLQTYNFLNCKDHIEIYKLKLSRQLSFGAY